MEVPRKLTGSQNFNSICCKIVKGIFMRDEFCLNHSAIYPHVSAQTLKKIQSMDLKKNISSKIKGNLYVHLSCIIVNVTVVM